ncbi:MAG: FAD:protein FMN transferase [Myxococcota bacterium]|nr:FAD:protein FMN transferase [Myxococcota bacterium]
MARAPLPLRARVALPLLLCLLGAFTAHLYGRTEARPVVELRGEALGTTWSVKIAAESLPSADQQAAQAEIEMRLARVDGLMSTWKADSELSRFNAHESEEPFPLSPETLAVFGIADEVSRASGGAFDVTIGPLVQAWGFGSRGPTRTPEAGEIEALREHTGPEVLVIGEGALRKTHPEAEADLSAVAKGYAVDEIARGLESLGIESFLIEVGGELRARGSHLTGAPWRVAIEAPVDIGRQVHRVVELRDQAMATSGDYRNFVIRDGKRLSHTIDPRSGRPIEHGLASVTVIHPEAAFADAWATALNVLGPDEGYALAKSQGLAAYLILREPGAEEFSVRMTEAFEPSLAPPRESQ